MKQSRLTPTTLRLILSIGIVLSVAAAATIFITASARLKETATAVSHKVADAEASQNSLTNLKKIEKFLAENQTTITRANDIVAESKSYEYQDQIINDLKTYAASADMTITNFDFSAGNTATAAPASGTAAPTAVTDPAAAAAPAPSGVKSTTVSVSLGAPLKYENLLRFVKAIEQNLTKMQISAITLSKGTTSNEVTTDTLTLEVYIR